MTPVDLGPAPVRSKTTFRREVILNATTAIATTGGYEAVRMRVVAERAGIAVGTLYDYFPSKPHLLVAVLTREFERLDHEDSWATIGDTPRQRLGQLNARLHREWHDRPAFTEAVTRAFVFAGDTAAAEVDHAATVIEHMLAHTIAGGDPTPRQLQIAGVVADIWLANLTAWIRQRTTTDEVGRRLAHAIRLLLADDSDDPVN
jgi:AcrR family transcriptional regulator